MKYQIYFYSIKYEVQKSFNKGIITVPLIKKMYSNIASEFQSKKYLFFIFCLGFQKGHKKSIKTHFFATCKISAYFALPYTSTPFPHNLFIVKQNKNKKKIKKKKSICNEIVVLPNCFVNCAEFEYLKKKT